MTTDFPASLDAYTRPSSADHLDSAGVTHSSVHDSHFDAIEALEGKVGADGSTVESSHDFKIAVLEAALADAQADIAAAAAAVLPGRLLAKVEATATSWTTTSTSLVDVDATNLAAAFTVPDSGVVIVSLNAVVKVGTTGNNAFWGLRAAAADIASSTVMITSASTPLRLSARILLSGLTPGPVTWKWAMKGSGSSAGQITILAGATEGPAVMEVWAG